MSAATTAAIVAGGANAAHAAQATGSIHQTAPDPGRPFGMIDAVGIGVIAIIIIVMIISVATDRGAKP